jgi:hypothetical protein
MNDAIITYTYKCPLINNRLKPIMVFEYLHYMYTLDNYSSNFEYIRHIPLLIEEDEQYNQVEQITYNYITNIHKYNNFERFKTIRNINHIEYMLNLNEFTSLNKIGIIIRYQDHYIPIFYVRTFNNNKGSYFLYDIIENECVKIFIMNNFSNIIEYLIHAYSNNINNQSQVLFFKKN